MNVRMLQARDIPLDYDSINPDLFRFIDDKKRVVALFVVEHDKGVQFGEAYFPCARP